VWINLPYIKEGVIATCSFIVSEEGRQRFDKFADVIGDDGFIRCHFKNKEISNIEGTHIYIRAPKDIFSLIKIKTRARLGNMELIAILIALIIRIRAKLQFKKLKDYQWEKDTSSR